MTQHRVTHPGETRSLFVCYHPHTQRRRYTMPANDGEAAVFVKVCRSCLSVKADDSPWMPETRWIDRGRLLSLGGVVLAPSWQASRDAG